MALLWVSRLRAAVLYADQLQRTIGSMRGAQDMVLDALRSLLKDEPFVDKFLRLPPKVYMQDDCMSAQFFGVVTNIQLADVWTI